MMKKNNTRDYKVSLLKDIQAGRKSLVDINFLRPPVVVQRTLDENLFIESTGKIWSQEQLNRCSRPVIKLTPRRNE
jgi:hypothetical protein